MPVRRQAVGSWSGSKCLGVDVGSEQVSVTTADAELMNTPVTVFANKDGAIVRWLKTLPPRCRIGMEATGKYHQRLAELAYQAGHTVYVFNPATIADYLRSLHGRCKNDVADPRGIARYVLNEAAGCHAYVPPRPFFVRLNLLIQRRRQVDKQRSSLRMSLADLPLCRAAVEAVDAALRALLADIDRQIEAEFRAEPELQARRKLLCSIMGFGRLVSAAVVARLGRIPYANSDAVVAAYGLDLRVRDSGKFCGQRKLTKHGNGEERRLIYIAAVSACNNPVFRALRDRLVARGRSLIQAHCCIARKLLRIAFAVWTSNQPYNAALVGTGLPPLAH